ncbi:unnamed protein product [Moneuplotes crassus]|uniref:Uncharacterized protein n=1 Tax=Euplotes crassus TaxID=5936 RepID=A0AAD1XCY0_EUPCR|nr:unnamed protein product [Moneuplotes crassus]
MNQPSSPKSTYKPDPLESLKSYKRYNSLFKSDQDQPEKDSNQELTNKKKSSEAQLIPASPVSIETEKLNKDLEDNSNEIETPNAFSGKEVVVQDYPIISSRVIHRATRKNKIESSGKRESSTLTSKFTNTFSHNWMSPKLKNSQRFLFETSKIQRKLDNKPIELMKRLNKPPRTEREEVKQNLHPHTDRKIINMNLNSLSEDFNILRIKKQSPPKSKQIPNRSFRKNCIKFHKNTENSKREISLDASSLIKHHLHKPLSIPRNKLDSKIKARINMKLNLKLLTRGLGSKKQCNQRGYQTYRPKRKMQGDHSLNLINPSAKLPFHKVKGLGSKFGMPYNTFDNTKKTQESSHFNEINWMEAMSSYIRHKNTEQSFMKKHKNSVIKRSLNSSICRSSRYKHFKKKQRYGQFIGTPSKSPFSPVSYMKQSPRYPSSIDMLTDS